jgi:carbon-monoxide dehydrogenase medium subunit/xanthine dehydrogenase FAD-binding subunit
MTISRLNVALSINLDKEGKATDVRISPGCVFATPDRVPAAEEVLLGKVPTSTLITEAGKKVSEEMILRTGVRWSTEYKKPVIEALTRRALKQALGVK